MKNGSALVLVMVMVVLGGMGPSFARLVAVPGAAHRTPSVRVFKRFLLPKLIVKHRGREDGLSVGFASEASPSKQRGEPLGQRRRTMNRY